MLLAIDTSGDTASLALFDGGQPLAELTWQCHRNHSTELLPRLNQLLEQNGLETGSITAIAVALGPGSYNGLRVGLATAKGLALSLGVPLVGLSTLEAEAYPHAATGLPIYAAAHCYLNAEATTKLERAVELARKYDAVPRHLPCPAVIRNREHAAVVERLDPVRDSVNKATEAMFGFGQIDGQKGSSR